MRRGQLDEVRAQAGAVAADCEQLLHYMAHALPLWPSAKLAGADRPEPPARPRRVRGCGLVHDWLKQFSVWQCRRCGALARTRSALSRRRSEACPGLVQWLLSLRLDTRGHSLAYADFLGGALVVCLKCGAFASSSPRDLLRPCKGLLLPGGRNALRALWKGRHPMVRTCLVSGLWSWSSRSLLPPGSALLGSVVGARGRSSGSGCWSAPSLGGGPSHVGADDDASPAASDGRVPAALGVVPDLAPCGVGPAVPCESSVLTGPDGLGPAAAPAAPLDALQRLRARVLARLASAASRCCQP